MTRNLANTRHGIPRGGLKAPAALVSNSPTVSNTRPAATPRRRFNASPSVIKDGLG